MIAENDPDVEELGKKYSYKNTERAKRKLDNQIESIEKE